MERRVWLESTTNTRDLGGLATADGRRVRRRLVFRSDALLAPTEADTKVLADLGLRHAIDLRSPEEVAAVGCNQLGAGVQVQLMPLVDEGTALLGEAVSRALRENDVALAEATLGDGRAQRLALSGATTLVRSAVAREVFAAVIHLIAAEDGLPLIFNCTAGKDRTGVMAALLLRLLGVDRDLVVDDYLLSNDHRAAHNAATCARLADAGLDVTLVQPLLEQQPGALVAMFAAIDDDFGDFEAYLRDGLGVEAKVLADVRRKLLEE